MLATSITDQASVGSLWTTSLIGLVIYIIVVVALWRVFSKAGWPGILAIIPIVSMVAPIPQSDDGSQVAPLVQIWVHLPQNYVPSSRP